MMNGSYSMNPVCPQFYFEIANDFKKSKFVFSRFYYKTLYLEKYWPLSEDGTWQFPLVYSRREQLCTRWNRIRESNVNPRNQSFATLLYERVNK